MVGRHPAWRTDAVRAGTGFAVRASTRTRRTGSRCAALVIREVGSAAAAQPDAYGDRDEVGALVVGEDVVEPPLDEQADRAGLEIEARAGIDAEIGRGFVVR